MMAKVKFIKKKKIAKLVLYKNKGKLEKVREWCQKNGYIVEESFFYTDSINDLPLIKVCPRSIIISPDKKLEDYALANNLEVLTR